MFLATSNNGYYDPSSVSPDCNNKLWRQTGGPFLRRVVRAIGGGRGRLQTEGAVAGHQRRDVNLVPVSGRDGSQDTQTVRVGGRRAIPGDGRLFPGRICHAVEVAAIPRGIDTIETEFCADDRVCADSRDGELQ